MNVLSADKTSKAMFYCNAAAFYAEKGALTEGLEAYTTGQAYYEKAAKDISGMTAPGSSWSTTLNGATSLTPLTAQS